ncbi:MAG: hypothetical protein KBT88_05575 [Gammaproteobacteria bacterium]|nr:hypothetical protein [Gammaproteobacteria bacterium]MBQ0839238.1 hypothetical protein [Gammaproteobacteria bacterium]
MPVSHKQKARNTSIFLAIFGAFFLLPGLGLLFFKAIPNLPRLFSSQGLSGDEFEAIIAEGIVGLVFSLLGGGLVYWGLKKPVDDADLLDSDTPWLGRKKWASESLQDSFALTGGLIWGFAIFWNLITTPALFAFSDELSKGNQLIWIVLAFPLVGLYLFGLAIHKTMDWRRFGQMTITLEPYPGAIGGDVAGTIHLPTPLPAGTPVKVSLDCVHHSSHGKNSSQNIVWQHHDLFEPQQSSRSTSVQFLFAVPANFPQSSCTTNSYHTWTLGVNAELAGVDLIRQIEVPVFPTEARARSSFRLNLKSLTSATNSADALFANTAGREQAIVGDHKNKGFVSGLIIGLIFFGLGICLAYFIGHQQNETFVFGFGALFSFIGLAILAFSVLARFRHYYLTLAKPLLELRFKSLFGGRVLALNYDEIAAVTTESRGSMSVGNKHYQFFNLGLKLKSGAALRLGERFSRQQVERTASSLARQLGVAVEENISTTIKKRHLDKGGVN